LCRCQVLLQVGLDKWVGCKAYFNPSHTKDCEGRKKNWNGENMNPGNNDGCNIFMQSMNRADLIMHYGTCCR